MYGKVFKNLCEVIKWSVEVIERYYKAEIEELKENSQFKMLNGNQKRQKRNRSKILSISEKG